MLGVIPDNVMPNAVSKTAKYLRFLMLNSSSKELERLAIFGFYPQCKNFCAGNIWATPGSAKESQKC